MHSSHESGEEACSVAPSIDDGLDDIAEIVGDERLARLVSESSSRPC